MTFEIYQKDGIDKNRKALYSYFEWPEEVRHFEEAHKVGFKCHSSTKLSKVSFIIFKRTV